ncbi:hypothetical protein ACKWTF_014467 [Chironomus riparius]
MSSNQSQSVITSIKPLIIATQLTAFTLFSINTKTWKSEVKKFNIFVGCMSTSFSLSLHYLFWTSDLRFATQGTEVTKNIMPMQVYSNLVIYTIVKLWNFFNTQKIVNFLRQINQIDEIFKDLGIYFDYKRDSKVIVKILIGIFALIIVSTVISACLHVGYLNSEGISLSLLNFYTFSCGSMLIVQFVTAMIGIRRRYETVNNFLILKPNLKIPEIKILSKIHLMTTESIEMFNIVYGPAVILFISLGFGWFCMFIFTLVMFPPIMWTDLLFVSLYNVLVNLMSFTTVAILFYYGEWTKKEARRTVKLLYKIIDDVNCEKIERKMQKMISQICDMKVEFSCGLVDFNWKFFFKFVTAAIMYFVILVQFESSFGKNNSFNVTGSSYST